MAELTAARNNALPYPVYGLPWVVTFALLDADGDPISPSSPDSEVSKNCDTAADCTNEAVEISGQTGVCYLILTATEMTADIVTVEVASTGAKTTILTLYPRKLAALTSGTCQGSNDTSDIQLASGDSAIDDIYNGCLCVATIDSTVECRIINDYVGSTKVAEVSPAWVTAQPDSNDTYVIYLPEGRSVDATNVVAFSGTAAATAHTAGYPVVTIKDGTGTGEINTTSGRVDADITHIATAAVSTSTAQLGVNLVQVGGSATPVTNIGVVYNTDFATNYNTTLDKWSVNVSTMEGQALSSNVGENFNTFFDNDGGASTVIIDETDVGLALESYNLHKLFASACVGADVLDNSFAAKLVSKSATADFDSFNNTTDALEALRDNMGTAQTGDAYAIVNSGTHGNAALKTLIDAVDNFVDTEIGTLSTDIAAVKSDTAAILVDTGTTLDGRIPAALVGGRMDCTIDATGMESGAVSNILTTAMTEAYSTDGSTMTLAQFAYGIWAMLAEASVSSTTVTTKKLDGSTTAMTFTINDASTPTSITRTT